VPAVRVKVHRARVKLYEWRLQRRSPHESHT
jgi:hypothetical protein